MTKCLKCEGDGLLKTDNPPLFCDECDGKGVLFDKTDDDYIAEIASSIEIALPFKIEGDSVLEEKIIKEANRLYILFYKLTNKFDIIS